MHVCSVYTVVRYLQDTGNFFLLKAPCDPKFVESHSPNTEGALRAPEPLRRHPDKEVHGQVLS